MEVFVDVCEKSTWKLLVLHYFVALSTCKYSHLVARDPLGGLEDVPALRLGPGPAAGQHHRELARPRPALQTRPHHSGGPLQQTLQHSNSQGSKGKGQ